MHTVCSNGSDDIAFLLRTKAGPSFDIGAYRSLDNETCLHLAVSKGHTNMVKYLLDTYPEMSNISTQSLNETPVFFLLSKLKEKPSAMKLKIAELFESKTDLSFKNKHGFTCYEAYADQHGIDETATFIENAAKKQKLK